MPLRFIESLKRFKLFSSFDPEEVEADPGDPDHLVQVTTVGPVEFLDYPIGEAINPDSFQPGEQVIAAGRRLNMKAYRREFTVVGRFGNTGRIILDGGFAYENGVIYGVGDRRQAVGVSLERP